MRVVDIALDMPLRTPLSWLPGDCGERIVRGCRAVVPLGARRVKGWILGAREAGDEDCGFRPVERVLDERPVLLEEHFELAAFAAREYFCSLGQALGAMAGGLARAAGEPAGEGEPAPGPPGYGRTVLCFRDAAARDDAWLGIARSASRGSVLFLFPEVAAAERFAGLCRGAGLETLLYHGELSARRRTTAWLAMMDRRRLVAVGTRMAVFAPLADLAAIVVDDEGHFAYREEQTPRYDACAIAGIRARRRSVPITAGVAAPSVAQYREIVEARATALSPFRPGRPPRWPAVIPLRRTTRDPDAPFLARDAVSLLEETLVEGRRAALVHHRKRSGRLLACPGCGHRFPCAACGVPLVPGPAGRGMVCRLCGASSPAPRSCPECGGRKLSVREFGVERMRGILAARYPGVPVLVETADARAGDLPAGPAVVIGTLAIESLLDGGVSAVVFLNGDAFMNVASFSAGERFFTTVMRWRMRLGTDGVVAVQTPDPALAVYRAMRDGAPSDFYEKELSARRLLGYPPFSRLARISVGGRAALLEERRRTVESRLREAGIEVLFEGPERVGSRAGAAGWRCIVRFPADAPPDAVDGLSGVPAAVVPDPEDL